MRRLGPALAIGAILLGGCSTTYQRSRPASVEQLQAMTERDATPREPRRSDRDPVTLLPSASGGGTDVAFPLAPSPDSRARGDGAPRVDLSAVGGYEVKRRLPGALEGLMLGLATGAAAGAIAGFSQGDDAGCGGKPCWLDFSAGDKAFIGGLFFGAAGGVVGALVGGLIGHTDRYLF